MELYPALSAIYEEYVQAAAALEAGRRPGDGLFGLGNDPKKDSCHYRFYQQVEQAVAAAGPLPPEEAAGAVSLILRSEERFPETSLCREMMVAAHRHALGLIPSLAPPEAAELLGWYQRQYPRFQRLPVQNQVLRALKARAGRK